MAAHQQVGDFLATNLEGSVKKNGGNVASYFLTPDGRVIHAVAGPVQADVLLAEAQWAVEAYTAMRDLAPREALWRMATAHQDAGLSCIDSRQRQVHALLATQPLPRLDQVYRHVFEKLLNEKISEAGPRLASAAKALELARRQKRPLLFAFYYGRSLPQLPTTPLTRRLMSEYVVVVMPAKEAPALSRLTGQPPYELHGSAAIGGLQLVTAHFDCRQISALANPHPDAWTELLATSLVEAMELEPPPLRELSQLQRWLKRVHPGSAEELNLLIARQRDLKRAERDAAS